MTPNDVLLTWSYFQIQDKNDQKLFNKVIERLLHLSKKSKSNGKMDTIVRRVWTIPYGEMAEKVIEERQ